MATFSKRIKVANNTSESTKVWYSTYKLGMDPNIPVIVLVEGVLHQEVGQTSLSVDVPNHEMQVSRLKFVHCQYILTNDYRMQNCTT